MSDVTRSNTQTSAPENGRNESLPFVSIILPVYNNADVLRRCLAALQKQTYPADRFEVIVVDNGSTRDDPQSVVAQFPGYQCIVETRVGSYAARNSGIAMARGEAFGFIDADCIASRGWLEAGARALLANPKCGLVGGRVELFVQDPQHPTSVELFERVHAFRIQEWIEREHKSVTANMFVWSGVFGAVGLFDAEFRSTGDTEWSGRVHAAGLRLIYDDEASLQHPARRTWRQIIKKHRRVVGGRRLLSSNREGAEHPRSLFRRVCCIIIPSIADLRRCCSDDRLKGRSEILRVAVVFVILHYVRVLEQLRLALGFAVVRD